MEYWSDGSMPVWKNLNFLVTTSLKTKLYI